MKMYKWSNRIIPVVACFLTGCFGHGDSSGAAEAEAHKIIYQVDEPGYVSMALYDPDGIMLRELMRGRWQEAGRHTLHWDGLDREGAPLSSGSYQWRLLRSPGLVTEYLMTLGTSMGMNPWPGVHGGPSSMTVVGDKMFMAGAGSETNPGIACSTLDGEFVWANHGVGGWGAAVDMSVIDGVMWMQYADGWLKAVNAEDGEPVRNADWMSIRFPVRSLVAQPEGEQTLAGFTRFPVEAYTPARGFGWLDAEGIIETRMENPAIPELHQFAHQILDLPPSGTRTLRIDVPAGLRPHESGHFWVRLHMGGGKPSPAEAAPVNVFHGPTWRTYYKADGSVKLLTFNVDTMEPHIDLTFTPPAGNTNDFGFTLHAVEVFALADLMAARGDQTVVASSRTPQIVWIDRDRPVLPSHVKFTPLGQHSVLHFYHHEEIMIRPDALLSPIQGSTERSAALQHTAGKYEVDLSIEEGHAHQVTGYFMNPQALSNTMLRVEIIDPITEEVLDTREVTDLQRGKYLRWNLRGNVRFRIVGIATGGFVNAWFLDPVTAEGLVQGQRVAFAGEDATTRGDWRGVYGRDGYLIHGSGVPRVVDAMELPGVQDVELLEDGSVLAIRNQDLVTFSRADKTPRVRVTDLVSPLHLAVDHGNGDILVAQTGASSQIVRFNKNFEKLATYGIEGGRQDGRYRPENFRAMSNVASDHRGGFLVSEWLPPPRRVAHFDGEGHLLREWYGGQMFYHSIGLDPESPSRVWLNSQFGSLIEMEVDYEKRDWRVYSTWILNTQLDPVLFPRQRGFQIWTHPVQIGEGAARKSYLGVELTDGLILDVDYEQGRLVPVAAAGSAQINAAQLQGDVPMPPDDHPWKRTLDGLMAEPGANPNLMHYIGYAYADLNGDREMQSEELSIHVTPGPHGWGHYADRGGPLGPDLSAWSRSVNWGASLWKRLPPVDYTAEGLPVWDLAGLQHGPRIPGVKGMEVFPLLDDHTLTIELSLGEDFGRWWHQTTWEGHGIGWPGTMVNETALVRRDAEGNVLWKSAPHHSGQPGERGRLHMPWRIAGVVDGYVGVTDQIRQPVQFWSMDGLYAGELFERRADDGLPERIYTWWRVDESVTDTIENRALLNYDMGGSGRLAKAPNGDVLFFGAGWNNVPVYKVKGWEKFERQEGVVQLTEPPQTPQGEGAGLLAEYFDNPELAGEPVRMRVDADIWFGFANKAQADGFRIPWPEADITIHPFSVRWTGRLEPRFSETMRILFYHRNSGVRVWVDERLVIDEWDGEKKSVSEPLDLKAGTKVPIRIEWRQLKANPEAHLNWESLSQPVQHIPTQFLYGPE